MSSISFDSKMYNSELVVSRSENSGGGRKQQQTRTEMVETLPPIPKPDRMQPDEPSRPEAAPEHYAGTGEPPLHSPGVSGGYVPGSDQPQPDPLVLVELRLFKEVAAQPETEPRGQGRLDVLI